MDGTETNDKVRQHYATTKWDDFARGVQGMEDATVMARQLFGGHGFFVEAARGTLAQVFYALWSLKPGTWRMCDALNAVRTQDTLRFLLETTPQGTLFYRQIFGGSAPISKNVHSVMHDGLSPFGEEGQSRPDVRP